MSLSTVVVGAALLASVTSTHPAISVTVGPAKTAAVPGATVLERVSNYGTLAERVSISIDQISRMNGSCTFDHSAPLATVSASSVYLHSGPSAPVRAQPREVRSGRSSTTS